MELVNEWLPTGKFRKIGTPFRKDCTHEKEIMDALLLTGMAPHKSEMEYNGKVGHTIGRIQHIYIMIRIDIFHTACHLETQTAAPNITGFQGFKR